MYIESKRAGRFQYAQTVGLTEKPAFPSQCIECGKCARHCPQHIQIPQELKNARRVLETPVYKAAKAGVKLLHIYG